MKKRSKDLVFYGLITAVNLLIYSAPGVFKRDIGPPLLYFVLVLFPSLAVCLIYERFS